MLNATVIETFGRKHVVNATPGAAPRVPPQESGAFG